MLPSGAIAGQVAGAVNPRLFRYSRGGDEFLGGQIWAVQSSHESTRSLQYIILRLSLKVQVVVLRQEHTLGY